MKRIALIGSTGSIGKQVLQVVSLHPEKFKIVSLLANTNYSLLQAQMSAYKPVIAGLCDAESAQKVTEIPNETTFYYGENALYHAINCDCDIVVVASVGFAGLKAVLASIKAKKQIALANKETLVAGGELIMPLIKDNGIDLVPIDSEHSAIWQALDFDLNKKFDRLILTASGGALRDVDIDKLKDVTPKSALLHPNWNMGAKITVDCATMVNKGFEVAEAKWLFNAPLDNIDVVIHRESIIHSMVQFLDGSVIAQMAMPDMKIPIALSLCYPERMDVSVPKIDFTNLTLTFSKPDLNRYPAFKLVVDAIKKGKNLPCVASGANEEAVKLFLQGKIKYTQIYDVIDNALQNVTCQDVSLESLVYSDNLARKITLEKFAK